MLTIAPLPEYIDSFPPELPCWKGSKLELEAHREKIATAAARAAAAAKAGPRRPRDRSKPATPRPSNAQAEAAKRLARADPIHQALLALQDAPADAHGPHDAMFWEEIFDDENEVDDEDCEDRELMFPEGLDLDATLSSLRTPERKQTIVGPDSGSDVSDSELFRQLDADALLPDEKPVLLSVRKPRPAPEPGDKESVSEVYSPTSAEASSKTSSDGSSSSSDSDASETARVAWAEADERHPADLVKDDDAPAGCTLRRYCKPGKPPYWHGTLPPGVTGEGGRHSRRRVFREGARTEAEALAQVEYFLNVACEEHADEDDG